MNPLIIANKVKYFFTSTLFFFGVVLLCIAGARGGDLKKSTRPITIIDSMNKINNPTHADVVLNTPFTIIRTLNQSDFKQRFKFDPKKASIAVLPSRIIIFGLIISTCSYKYSEYLEISETFNDWLKQVPFGFLVRGLKVNKDRSVTFIFKNSLDSERWIEE